MIKNELELALQEARLPANPSQIIGRLYKFECEHGSHHNILIGTILAIQISDEGGLDLYVSNTRFWGDQLISIKRTNGKWMAYVGTKGLVNFNQLFAGSFWLL